MTKPRYTHKSLSVACPALIFYSYALCWRNKMTAEFLQWKIWRLSYFLCLPPSFAYSVYPSLYYSVTSQFCSLPFLSVFCFLFIVAVSSLAMHFSFCCLSLSPFVMLFPMSFYLNVYIFLYLLYRFLIVLLLSHSYLPITGHLFDVKLTLSFKSVGSVRHFNFTERSLIFSPRLYLFN